jgi:ketosteroid isomerase-like protein
VWYRHGKAAVLDMVMRLIPEVFRIFSLVPDAMLVDGDQAATLSRLTARSGDGRVISYRLAHFVRFRAGKIVRNLSIIDSFDAVEQVLGHPLDVHECERREAGDLIAV